jgi:hypothetical protein
MIVRADNTVRARVQDAVDRQGFKTHRNRKPVLAYINHGRWLADCVCNGGELVSEGEDMLCGSCGTISPVTFPDGKDEIERLLLLRVSPIYRHWRPGESEAEILAQNIDNGIWEDK